MSKTRAQLRKRKDNKWYWRFLIRGNLRFIGTDLHATKEQAKADLEECMSYDLEEEEGHGTS